MKLLCWLVVGFVSFTLSRADFVECDLDLDDPAILSQLPPECQNVNEATKALMLTEAASFKQFHQKLSEYEAAQAPEDGDGLHMDMEFRNELYAAANLHTCLNGTESLDAYIRCVTDRRQIMLDMLEQHTATGSPQQLYELVGV